MFNYLGGWNVRRSAVHGMMKIYPIFRDPEPVIECVLAQDAMANQSVVVTEGSGEQSLLLRNTGDARVLFIEGQVLDRGHQNRGVNATILVPGRRELALPVSCVEKGRSTGQSTVFSCSSTVAPASVRATLKTEVTESLFRGNGHHTSNRRVWRTISQTLDASQTVSDTESLIQVHATHEQELQSAADRLPYVPGASGIAFALGMEVVAVDLFDRPEFCAKLWRPLVESFAISAIGGAKSGSFVNRHAIANLLGRFTVADWQMMDADPGLGQDCRAAFERHVGSALVVDGKLVHASLILAA